MAKWETKITNVQPNKIMLRGYPIDELMGQISFAQAVYLTLKGEMPNEKVGKVMDTILVASIDHGVTPPSALATLNAASTGAPVNACLASGILSINRFHGGAIEDCMGHILDGMRFIKEKNISIDEAADLVVKEAKTQNIRLAGFGHRIHSNDPRTAKIFSIVKDNGIWGKYCDMIITIESKLEENSGKKLPINVDGAIGAVLLELGFDRETANAFFIMSRIPGLLAHIIEEKSTQKPMRKIDLNEWEYTGHPERHL